MTAGFRANLRRGIPDLVCIGVAFALWAVFRPGNMSSDSIWQYGMAVRGVYNDGHPPLMSIVLAGFLRAGLGIGALVLVQSLAGCLGVYRAAEGALEFFSPSWPAPVARRWLALGVLLWLLTPWSPLGFYLVTFWKDSWVAIALSWVLVFGFQLWKRSEPARAPWRLVHAVLLLVAMLIALNARLNARFLLPIFSLLLAIVLRPRRVWQACAAATLPAVLYFASDRVIHHAFAVRHVFRSQVVMALDLTGALALHPEIALDLPYTSGLVRWTELPNRYRWGEVAPLYYESPAIVEPELTDEKRRNPDLRREYLRAWKRHPLTMMEVKLRAFVELLGLTRTYYFFEASLIENDYGLQQNQEFVRIRGAMTHFARYIGGHPRLRWLGGVPAVWLCVNLVWLLAALVAWRRAKHGAIGFSCVLLAIPLVYAGSYLVATPARDFRFMYPAIVLVQVLLIPCALVHAFRPPRATPSRARAARARLRRARGLRRGPAPRGEPGQRLAGRGQGLGARFACSAASAARREST